MIAYADYAKDFDTVSCRKLVAKLTAYGISGNLLRWISNFLLNCHQLIKLGTAESGIVKLASGVVQSRVLYLCYFC